MELPSVIDLCGTEYVRGDVVAELREQLSQRTGPEPVFTAAQVAEMSGVSKRTIYNLMDKGIIAFIVPNGCTKPRLVTQTTYEKWIGLR